MFNSKKYWNDRYVTGGNSGSGSYNNLAKFKGDVINNFIEKNQIKSIVDYGVGDGNQLKLFNTEKLIYTGIDVSKFIISKCKEEFKDDKTKKFIHVDNIDNELKGELVLSCDVIYHLIEEHVYKEYMDNLFSMSKKYVIIYATNINYNEAVHVKKREFIEYIFDNYTKFNLVKRIKGNIGDPFYIFQKNDTYTPTISKNILQISKKFPVDTTVINKIKILLDGYDYYWFNDENMYKYIQNNQLEEFPNLINHIKSLTKGPHKADIFRYYWLYLNGGIFMDDDLMIEKKIDFKNNTFVSVKSYHTNKNLLFNGFIACSKFNPILYKALKQSYYTNNIDLINNYHLFCAQLYIIYQKLYKRQNTFLLQEIKDINFKDGVKSYYNEYHILTHSKKISNSVNIIDNWKTYIKNNLLPIIKLLNVKLEGNIYSSHLTFNENLEMKDKQSNICHILKNIKPKTILEIGFNAGFSCLLMKMLIPDVNITCIDLNEHKYVMPCFNKISSDFSNLNIIPGSSYDVGLPQLIKKNMIFDLIHIDGDHRLEGARKDIELCIKLCHDNTIIIFDDTNINYLDDLCSLYVKKGILKDYHFKEYLNKQHYKHRFLQINKYKTKDITYNISWDWNNYKKEEKDNFDYTILNTYKTNKNLVRIGPKNDGGYVIVKEIDYDLYLSCGLAGNTNFDNAILNMYPHLKAYGFNGYIDKLPVGTNKYLKFIKKNISDFDDDKNTTLKEYLTNYNNILLQMDIEGAEFKWLNCISIENISKFSQILLEVHWPFDNFRFNALKKLNDTHYLVHIHGNNYCNRDFPDKDIGRSYDGTILINNPNLTPIFLPEVMELTYIRKNLVNNIEKMNYNFPRNFDSANNPRAKDIKFKIPGNELPLSSRNLAQITMKPVYISLTSIYKNQDILLQTLQSIMKQTRLPDKIFLYLSEEPYILDTGFKNKKITNSNLLKFINDNSIIDIKWVKNTGSYRKLLPLLKYKWDEDCIIITIDDDTIYDTNLIKNLINDYNEHNCVIGYRGFKPLFDKLENFDYSKRDKLQHLSSHNFLTGKGGILYKPQFFYKTHDLIFNDKIYLDTCPTADDIWFYIVRLLNNVKCYSDNKQWGVKDLTNYGLFHTFNMKDNNKSFKNTFQKLKDLGYNVS